MLNLRQILRGNAVSCGKTSVGEKFLLKAVMGKKNSICCKVRKVLVFYSDGPQEESFVIRTV